MNQSLSEQGLLLKQKEHDPEMHSVAKGNKWFFGMRCHIGVDADSGLVHSLVSTAANVHELNTAADWVHGVERVIYYGNSVHIGIEKRDAFKDCGAKMRIAMKPGQRRVLPDTPEGKLLELVERANAHLRAKVEHLFRIINASLDSERSTTGASGKMIRSSRYRAPWPIREWYASATVA